MGRLFNLVMRAATGLAIADTQCGFKLFRGDVAQSRLNSLSGKYR